MGGDLVAAALLHGLMREALSFAAPAFALSSLDDLLVNAVYFVRVAARRLTIYRRYPRGNAAAPIARDPGRFATSSPPGTRQR